jgi:hypothetical protein
MLLNKAANLIDRPATFRQMLREGMPDMPHLLPDVQADKNPRVPSLASQADGIAEQDFIFTDVNQKRREMM